MKKKTKSYFKLVRVLFRADKKILAKVFFVVFLFLGFEAAIPLYMQWLVNDLEVDPDWKHFILYVASFALIYLIFCFVDEQRVKSYYQLGKHLLWKVRSQIYEVIWKSNYIRYVQNQKENLKYILATETYRVFSIVTVYTINLVLNFLTVVVFLGIAYYLNPLIASILFAAFLLMFFLSFFSGKRILAYYEKFDAANEKDTESGIENIDMIEVVRINGLQQYYSEKNYENLTKFSDLSADSDGAEAFWENVERAFHYIIYVVIAGVLVLSSSFRGGEWVTILFITNYLLETSQQFQRQLQVIIKNIAVFDRVDEITSIPLPEGKRTDTITDIRFEQVSLQYEERAVFRDLNLHIGKGDKILLRGANGSGKSSILKMIVGLINPTEGTLYYNGINSAEFDASKLYQQICYVSQEELMLNETLEGYLSAVCHKSISSQLIRKMREKVSLHEDIVTVTDNGKTLSGGEKKKLLLMKAMLNSDKDIYLFDEVDAGLDRETKEVLHKFEQQLLSDPNKTIIKISHIDESSDGYDKVVNLS
ncbi:MAG: ATP-binding cassette domain-containing protein [Clostridiales bacterium]|nr:ATP-binding cassette domain-containing protein [Clostridiales bacterium]